MSMAYSYITTRIIFGNNNSLYLRLNSIRNHFLAANSTNMNSTQ